MTSVSERLRRVKYMRTMWLEPEGEVDVQVFPDMAGDEDVRAVPINPDGPEAADLIDMQTAALRGLLDLISGTPAIDSEAAGNAFAAIAEAEGRRA